MTRAVLFLFAICGSVGNATAADLIQLVPGGPPPAVDIAKDFGSIPRGKAIASLISYLGPQFNQSKLLGEMQERLDGAIAKGWGTATKLGQNGFVVRVRSRVTSGVQPMLSLGPEDVVYIGTGPSALDVCVAERCDLELQPAPPPGTKFSANSGYLWIAPANAKTSPMRFHTSAQMLESVRFTVYSEQGLAGQRSAARAAALDGYVRQLSKVTASTKDKAAVLELLSERDKAKAEFGEIEKKLAEERERARKAADAARMLTGLSTAFSLASSIAAANASTGLDLEKVAGGKIPNKQELSSLLKRLSDESGAKVTKFAIEQQSIRDGLTGAETRLIGIGIKYQMDPKEASVFKQSTP